MPPELQTTMRELESRDTAGLQVRLMWCESDGRLFVRVSDRRTGEKFSVEVHDGEQPLQVFNHPYAYAPDA